MGEWETWREIRRVHFPTDLAQHGQRNSSSSRLSRSHSFKILGGKRREPALRLLGVAGTWATDQDPRSSPLGPLVASSF